MRTDRFVASIAVPFLVVAAAGFNTLLLAEDDAAHDTHYRKVHKIVVDCDEDSGEDCERRFQVEVMGGPHATDGDEHSMVWVHGDGHGPHRYGFSTGGSGKGGFLGVQLTELTPELRTHFGVPEDEGVMVAKVVDDSAAFRAGLAAGDIITAVDSDRIGSTLDLIHAVRSREEGESVSLEIWRDGSFSTLVATLEKQEMPRLAHRAVFIDCQNQEGDCEIDFSTPAIHDIDLGCNENAPCDVKIRCGDGECECTVNGEAVDCPELHPMHHGD